MACSAHAKNHLILTNKRMGIRRKLHITACKEWMLLLSLQRCYNNIISCFSLYSSCIKKGSIPVAEDFYRCSKSAVILDRSGTLSLQSSREVVSSRYGDGLTPQGYLRPAPSSSYKSRPNKEEKHDRKESPTLSSVSKSGTGRWVPPSILQDVGRDRNESIFRRVRGILNKLTPEKFDKLIFDLLNVGIDSKTILKGIILLIFEKALEESKYSSLYAQLCLRLSHDAPNFDDPSTNNTTFRRLLLSKCQEEFECRSKASAAYDKNEEPLTPDQQEEKLIAKRKMLGNIKFIGELGKLGMLHESILHKCIQQLLAKKKRSSIADMAEDIECLSQIMSTVGKRLDVPKAKNIMDQYFDRIEMLSESRELPSRIRFMLQDTIELRRSKWVPRKAVSAESGPRSVSQMRWEAYGPASMNIRAPMFPPPLSYPFPPPPPMQLTPGGGIKTDWFSDGLFGPGPPLPPGAMPGMFPHMPPASGMRGMIDKDAEKDIFGKAPAPKNPQLMAKIQTKTDLFEPHYLKNKQPQKQQQQQQQPQQAAISKIPSLQPSYSKVATSVGHTAVGNTPSVGLTSSPGNTPQTMQAPVQQPSRKFDLFDDDDYKEMLKPSNNAWNPVTDPFSTNVLGGNLTNSMDNKGLTSQPVLKTNGLQQQEPRPFFPFSKTAPKAKSEISLRPASFMASKKKEEEPKAEEPPTKGQANQSPEKSKSKKSPALSKAEFEKKVDTILLQYRNFTNLGAIIEAFTTLLTAPKYSRMLVKKLLKCGYEKDADYWGYLSRILVKCHKSDLIQEDILMEGLENTAEDLKMKETEMGPSYMTEIGEVFLKEELVPFGNFGRLFENGSLHPAFIKCLQKLKASKGESWLSKKVNDSKLDLMKLLPTEEQANEKLLDVAEEAKEQHSLCSIKKRQYLHFLQHTIIMDDIKFFKGLIFLFPKLRLQAELVDVLKTDAETKEIHKWIKDNMLPVLTDEKVFIHALISSVLKCGTKATTMAEGVDLNQMPDKELQEKEKEPIKQMQPILKEFLDGRNDLQLEAIYAIQLFCHTTNFPKGMMLRLFILFYDLELIEEDAYMKWKEDINDEYPGKGKALFQVNNWLQWLETADEEDETDDEETEK